MPSQVQFDYQTKNATKVISSLARKVKDFKPVWGKFIVAYSKLIRANFETNGKVMQQGQAWQPVTERYARRKIRGGGDPKKILRWSGLLARLAARPEPKFDKQQLLIEWDLPVYGAVHQFGYKSIPQRPYLFTDKETLPLRALRTLIKILDEQVDIDG